MSCFRILLPIFVTKICYIGWTSFPRTVFYSPNSFSISFILCISLYYFNHSLFPFSAHIKASYTCRYRTYYSRLLFCRIAQICNSFLKIAFEMPSSGWQHYCFFLSSVVVAHYCCCCCCCFLYCISLIARSVFSHLSSNCLQQLCRFVSCTHIVHIVVTVLATAVAVAVIAAV